MTRDAELDLSVLFAGFGEIARVASFRRLGVTDARIRAAERTGGLSRPRRGWVASPSADRDQLRAIAAGGRIGCLSALRRLGVWSGVDDVLHVSVPRSAPRVLRDPRVAALPTPGVWHPAVPESRRVGRAVRLAAGGPVRVHYTHELHPDAARDWIVSPRTALATAVRCLPAEHASAAIDSALHERVLSRRDVDAVLAALPSTASVLVDEFSGLPESGVESLFVRRVAGAGYRVETQVEVDGIGRIDGRINGCVLFEIDGRGFHSGPREFYVDRDRTLVSQAFGMPVLRPSARHVLEDWPFVAAALARVVADAELVAHVRGSAVR
jgi:hypothetical protein